ncbi:MAG: hypothetical protein DWQ31_12685 [Planctomycetota bacterium]|nr:MAG: hypothetical protein DWQ31_12685 [Planctomycetota bacterium]REJ95668.1 MAG: hypothetical protein DWQ35_06135 [Planctomycetota bacterium]REK29179.1 MAG: hypothetical protein DWQ42_03965 [Planctomycetota bacterium]REK46969.1 MAG: hypothetical protein DWQ46_05615 [Planctomycetota bacterium]
MDVDLLGISLRWLHIMAAITLFGGLIFSVAAVIPASSELGEAERDKLREAIRRRWAKYVGIAILVLIATGTVNLVMHYNSFTAFDGHEPPSERDLIDIPKGYAHGIGTKIGLAFVVFFLASLLNGRGRLAQKMRPAIGKWACVTIVLAMTIVAISAWLRSTHTGPNVAAVKAALMKPAAPPPDKETLPDPTEEQAGDDLKLNFDTPTE